MSGSLQRVFHYCGKLFRPDGWGFLFRKAAAFRKTVRSSGWRMAFSKARWYLKSCFSAFPGESDGIWTPARVFIGDVRVPANSYESHYEEDQDFSKFQTDIKALAFYLPQFHTFPENDQWWGKGFTEWTNTRKATPRFPSHYQPREPHDDIGYYDLSDWRTLERQARMVRRHGLYGLCIYHYWFSGKRLMEKPLDLLLEHPEIDLKFCLCWANENWTRNWDGCGQSILIAQKHEDDDVGYIRDLKKYLMDPRYIRADGRPLVLVYRPGALPDAPKTFRRWREWARENGIGEIRILVVRGAASGMESVLTDGADGEVEFPPSYSAMPPVLKVMPDGGEIMDYPRYVNEIISGRGAVERYPHPVYRTAMLGWDCTPRRKAYHCWYGFSPERYYLWLRYNIEYTRRHHAADDRFIFINAWNEWAEGTYLEPDRQFGYTNLNTTSRAIFDIPLEQTAAEAARIAQSSPFFDRDWYLRTYPDVAASGRDPLRHFFLIGWKEGRSPSAYFPNALYLFFEPGLRAGNTCPLADFYEKHRTPDYLEELCRRFDALQEKTRSLLKIDTVFPDRLPVPETLPKRKIAVHLHCFYEDMLPEIREYLKNIPCGFDLRISLPQKKGRTVDPEQIRKAFFSSLPQLRTCRIHTCPNRGRDIAPLICVFGKDLLEYDYICHIHTKKSLHTAAHAHWADYICRHLFGDGPDWVRRIFSLLEENAGIVCPPDFLMMREEPSGWGSNMAIAKEVFGRRHPEISLKKDFPVIEFPQGSMFWAKSSYLAELLSLDLTFDDFPPEPLDVDGTLPHALERLFFLWGIRRPERVCQVFLPGEEDLPARKRYWFEKIPETSGTPFIENSFPRGDADAAMKGENMTDPNLFSRIWNRISGRKALLAAISELEQANGRLTDALSQSERRTAEHFEADSALRARVSELEQANGSLRDTLTKTEARIAEEQKGNTELRSRLSGLDRANRALTARLDLYSDFTDEQKKYIAELKERIARFDKEKCGAGGSPQEEEEMFAICAGLIRKAMSDEQENAGLRQSDRLFRKVCSAALSLLMERDQAPDDPALEHSRSAETLRSLIRESGLFDRAWYLARNPDVREAGIDPLTHFMETGWREGRDPSPRFSLREYLELNQDVRRAGVMPLVHFLRNGISEGRIYHRPWRESELFRVFHRLGLAPELYKAGGEAAVRPDLRVGVFLHLDRAVADEGILRRLRGMPCPFDLYLTFRSSTGREAGSLTEQFRASSEYIGKIETAFSPEASVGADLLLGGFGAGLETYDAVFFSASADGSEEDEAVPAEKQTGEIRFILSRLADGLRLIFPSSSRKDRFPETGGIEAIPAWLQSRLLKTSDDPERETLVFSARSSVRTLSEAGVWMRGDALKTLRAQARQRIGSGEGADHQLTPGLLADLVPLLTLPAGGKGKILFRADVPLDAVRFSLMDHITERCGTLLSALSDPGLDLVLVSHDADHSGSPMLALSLARELKRAGMSFLAILLKDGCLRPEFEKCGPVRVIPADELRDVLKEVPASEGPVFRRVLLNTVISGALAPSFRSAGFRVVTLIHEMGESVRDNGWKTFAEQVVAGSDRIVMPSNLVSGSWSRIGCPVSGKQLRIQPQGNYRRAAGGKPLDREECRKHVFREFGLPEGSKLVLSASAFLERRKGVAVFLDTAEIFRRNGEDDVFFLWLGDDSFAVLQEPDIAGRMKDARNCLFPGFRSDLAPFMAAADVFFLPSLADPFPTVVLQAADQGTPVVLCEFCTGCSDFCRNFEAGMVPEYSAEMFAGEIGKLIRDPALRSRVSEQILAFSRSYPSPDQYLRTLLGFFDVSCDGTPSGMEKLV